MERDLEPFGEHADSTAGDLVIGDNRSVWHYAVDDYGDQERWGLKISIEGGDWRPN